MQDPRVTVSLMQIDNSLDEDFANLVRICDYDKQEFLLLHVIFTDEGSEPQLRKKFKDSDALEVAFQKRKHFLVNEGNWNVRLSTSFNPTAEILTSIKAFEDCFASILGLEEARHLFKAGLKRTPQELGITVVDVESPYQIKTTHEGIWQ